MTCRTLFLSLGVAALLGSMGSVASAQAPTPVLISVDELGNAYFSSPILGNAFSPGFLEPDPGPGGLPAALTYNLLGPPSLVAGDIRLLEPITGAATDLIRFNPTGTAPGYAASLVFYSDNLDGLASLGDTGLPSSTYTNLLTFTEVGPEGNNGFIYTPTAGQPGFIAGFLVTYDIHSDGHAVPEPASLVLFVIGGVGAIGLAVRRRRRAV
jgi:hypothetical protein